jgi:predicted  nucleic acid-binding Zn-ribbon protein
MEREVQSEFDKVWAILERTAQRGEQAEARFNRRMDRAEKRMDAAEKRMEKFDRRMELAEQRMDRAEQRGDLADKRIEATRKLVEAGMKIVMRNSADIRALGKRMDAYVRSARNGHNGNGHGPKRSR